ncbi:MAG: hypothetical protein M1819_005483 [Sarea resinae]|nr:MAG: hypothetical protein M1819_005483 [Sarea resinae]
MDIDPRLRAPATNPNNTNNTGHTHNPHNPHPQSQPHPHSLSHPHSHSHSHSRSNPGSNSNSFYGSTPAVPPPSFGANPVRLPAPAPHQQPPPPTSDLPLVGDSGPPPPYYGYASSSSSHHPVPSIENSLDPVNGDPKRPRACEACRGLKVRCEPDAKNLDGPCRRCAKAGRQCVVTQPNRKRQKKTDSRVAELERKIDALTASLQATKSGQPESLSDEYSQDEGNSRDDEPASVRSGMERQSFPKTEPLESPLNRPPRPPSGLKRKFSDQEPPRSGKATPTLRVNEAKDDNPNTYPFLVPKASKPCPTCAVSPEPSRSQEYVDVVDRKLIEPEMATNLFDRYVNELAPHLPVVVFPAGTTAADIRKTKPTLFLATISAASGILPAEIQRALSKEIIREFAERIMVQGEKTLELIQALQVSTLWYWPPEHYEELKFYQLVHIAAVMALEVGICKRSNPFHKKNMALLRDHPWRKTPYPRSDAVESRRAWLGSYFTCALASMALRRPNLIRWTPYTQECIDILESSPEAAPSDKTLCFWVKNQHLCEEVGQQFSMDDTFASVGISEPKVQYALKAFERQLADWKSQIPRELFTPDLKLGENVANLYMHEVAMHVDHNVDDFRPPFTEEALKSATQTELLTAAHTSALTTCLTSIHGIFDTFLALDLRNIRALPIFHFVRIAYANVVLIKMHFAVTAKGSELGKIFGREDLKVDRYLDSLLDRLRASAEEGRSRPATKFLMILIMLKAWFQKQSAGKVPQREGAGVPPKIVNVVIGELPLGPGVEAVQGQGQGQSQGPTQVQTPRQGPGYPQILSNEGTQDTSSPKPTASSMPQSGYSTANTPLHLLSEVAMGNSDGGGVSSAVSGQGRSPWYDSNGAGPGAYSNVPTSNANMPMDYLASGMTGDVDFEAAMGDGFDEAMEMTLGDGQLSDIFMQNGFFNLMNGTPTLFESWG